MLVAFRPQSKTWFQVDGLDKGPAKAGSWMRHPRSIFREANKLALSLLIRRSLSEISLNKDNVNNNDFSECFLRHTKSISYQYFFLKFGLTSFPFFSSIPIKISVQWHKFLFFFCTQIFFLRVDYLQAQWRELPTLLHTHTHRDTHRHTHTHTHTHTETHTLAF